MEEIDTVAKAIMQAQADHPSLTGVDVATKVGISTSYYSDIRKGNNILDSSRMLAL